MNTSDDSGIFYLLEDDLKFSDDKKTKKIPFCHKNRKIDSDSCSPYMDENKPNTYTQKKKVISDRTDEKKYLIHYSMLNFYVRHGMIVAEIHENISFKQSECLENYIAFNKWKWNEAKNEFEKDFYKLLNIAFLKKMLVNIRNRIKMEFY